MGALWTGSLPAQDAPPGLSTLYPGKTQYSTDTLNVPLFMSGSNYFDAAASWYKDGLPTTSAGKSTGGMAPAGYVGSGKDFLDSYFRTGLQTSGPGTAAPSGSSSNAANSQILKKSSAYWVATTHVQYNLDMADINIAANRTAEAKANMDSAAAAYFGCGDTNPVPLPKYKGTQITYPTTAATTDIGSNATTMSIYGVANKRAANYLTAKAVPGGTSSATSPGTTKTVAELNIGWDGLQRRNPYCSHRTGYPGRHQHHLRSGCAAVHCQDYPGGSHARQRHGRFHKTYSGYHDTREEPHHRLLGVLLGDLGANRNQQKAGNCLWWVELADAPGRSDAGGHRWGANVRNP